jgi:hypothetical protein
MKSFIVRLISSLLFTVCVAPAVWAQIEFDKPKVEGPLPNPYTLAAKREDIMKAARDLMKACLIPIDETNSKDDTGKLLTKSVVYTRGVTANSDLEHLANMGASDVRNFLQGRYALEITSLPVDQAKAQIQIAARIQGRLAGRMGEVWVDGISNGQLEDEVLRGLAGRILGIDLSMKRRGGRRILSCEY